MHSIVRAGLAAAALFALAACGGSGSSPGASNGLVPAAAGRVAAASIRYHNVCGPVQFPDQVRCFAIVRDDAAAQGLRPDYTPAGYGPADLQSAYHFNPTGGAGVTVAIVDAYDNPNLESDLAVYRAQFGLPACTASNGCFKKTDQSGGQHYPKGNKTWGAEEALDVDMVSANCPNCNILVVEANKPTWADLGAAVTKAATLGANVISNSYGGQEFANEDTSTPYDQNRPVIASSGDSGYGPQYPAASQYVFAVGGTSLTQATSTARGWSETVWTGSGSGCSAYAPKPSWQLDTGCAMRTIGDIAYDADPATGVAVYNTYGDGGWTVYGGTSVAAPSIAAMIAATGAKNVAKVQNAGWLWVKGHHTAKNINDITTGSNGECYPAYLCNGEKGYDGPSGWGTPNGLKGL